MRGDREERVKRERGAPECVRFTRPGRFALSIKQLAHPSLILVAVSAKIKNVQATALQQSYRTLPTQIMSSKRKWDDEANPAPPPAISSDAAAQAGKCFPSLCYTDDVNSQCLLVAAIAARIAATMSGGLGASPSGGAAGVTPKDDKKDPYDGAFTYDIDINDLRNRYLITKGATQHQVRKGAQDLGLRNVSYSSIVIDIDGDWCISNDQRCLVTRPI